MQMTKIATLIAAGAMFAASAGASFAQTTTGGTGSSGNDSNNPAAIQGGGAMNNGGTTMMKDETGATKLDNSGAVQKPGKECGQRGENQGTSQPDGKVACE